MNELSVIKYLRDFEDGDHALVRLKEKYGIEAKQHPDYPELYQFHYSQIDSPKTEPIVRDCRGLILSRKDNWRVIALPFRRFFNYGEAECEKEIDWTTASVQDKADGSLIICYHYKMEWHIATRGNPKADSKVGSYDVTFRELFNQAVDESLFEKLDVNRTYLFEVCSPYNRVVVNHYDVQAFSLACFDIWTYKEYPPFQRNALKHFPLTSVDSVIGMARELNPLDQEGYVVVDSQSNRLKIKSPKYVALHHIIGSMSQRKMIELVRHGETEEILSYYPELKKDHDKIKSSLDQLVEEAQEVWEVNKDISDQKSFALQVKNHPLAGVLFNLRNEKVKTVREGVQSINLKTLERMLNLKETPEDENLLGSGLE